jgi:predicted nucleic acid-binding Zn ribbon protein
MAFEENRKPEFLNNVVGKIVKELGWEEKFDEAKLKELWKEVVGSRIANHSNIKKLDKGKLIIETSSSTWRAELFLRREMLIEEMNKHLGKKAINEIIIR